MQRNAVAAALSRLHALPRVLQDPQTCGSCSQLGLCAVLYKVGPASCMAALGGSMARQMPSQAMLCGAWETRLTSSAGEMGVQSRGKAG